MPSITFVDEEAIKELKKLVKSEEEINLKFPEHDFFATALKIGITIEDLKELTYVDILKIFIYAIIIIVCVLVCREFGYSAMLRSS